MTTRLACVLAAAVFVAVGCGDDDKDRVDVQGGGTNTSGTETTGTSTEAAGAPVETVKVSETEYKLSPANPSISKAGVVQFNAKNDGSIVHALEVEGPNGEVETEGIQPGKSATLKADLSKAGRYEWYCPIADHKERGMKGEITVAGGGSGAKEDESGATEEDGSTKESKGGYGY